MGAQPFKERRSTGTVEFILPLPAASKPVHARIGVVIVIGVFIGQVLATIYADLTPIVPAVWFIVFSCTALAEIIGRRVITITPKYITTHRTITTRIQRERQVIASTTELVAVLARHQGTIGGEAIHPKNDPAVLAFVLPDDDGREVICDVLDRYSLNTIGPLAGRIAQAAETLIEYDHDIHAAVIQNSELYPDALFEPTKESLLSISEEDEAINLRIAPKPFIKSHRDHFIASTFFILFGAGMVVAALIVNLNRPHDPVNLFEISMIALVIATIGAFIWTVTLLTAPRKKANILTTPDAITIAQGKKLSADDAIIFSPASLVAIQAATPKSGEGLELRFMFHDGVFLNALQWASEEDVVLASIALRQALSLPSTPTFDRPGPRRTFDPGLN